jgi:hypothetical protein
MRKYILIFLLIISFSSFGQTKEDLSFIQYLVNKGYYKEAVFLIDKTESVKFDTEQRDSLNYYCGWANYCLKELDESTFYLLKVSGSSPFYNKSRYFAGYNQIYCKNYSQAQSIFKTIEINKEPEFSLKKYELGGIEMLNKNWREADSLFAQIDKKNALVYSHLSNLQMICDNEKDYHSKSPVLAGIMSGIIPGSGKIYAGKTGAGIASMISNVGLGLITWENYHKEGLKNAKTLIFGSLFFITYTSNIYGSVISVKIIEDEHEKSVQNQILFELHIPLRNFFN